MRFSVFVLALAGFAVAAPVPLEDTADAGVGERIGSKLKDGAEKAAVAGALKLASHAADKLNKSIQDNWSEEAQLAKQAKVDKAATEVKGKGVDAMGALTGLAKGLAGAHKPSEKKH